MSHRFSGLPASSLPGSCKVRRRLCSRIWRPSRSQGPGSVWRSTSRARRTGTQARRHPASRYYPPSGRPRL